MKLVNLTLCMPEMKEHHIRLYGTDGGMTYCIVHLPSAQLYGVCQPIVSVNMCGCFLTYLMGRANYHKHTKTAV